MPTYHLSLYSGKARLAAAEFVNASDAKASAIAAAVFGACIDACDGFELRREAHYIAGIRNSAGRRAMTFRDLESRTREIALEVAENLASSNERLAASRRLLAEIDAHKKSTH